MIIGFELNEDAQVVVNLPPTFRAFISHAADIVAENVADSSAPGYARVCSPVDPSLDDDDPLARLERQMTIEALCEDVRAHRDDQTLSVEQAESWIRVLTMASAILAHVNGVFSDEDRENVDSATDMFFDVSSALQCSLVYALDPDIATHERPEE